MKKLQYCFLLALLLHLLFFAALFNYFWQDREIYQPDSNNKTGKVLPAYVYHEEGHRPSQAAKPIVSNQTTTVPTQEAQDATPLPEKTTPISPEGIYKKYLAAKKTARANGAKKQVVSTSQATSIDAPAKIEIRNLTSDKAVDKPLLKLLSKATAEKLVYPKAAIDFRVTGTAKIGFMLYPNGEVVNATVVESSGSGILDQAALQAINAISPVKGVDKYLTIPKIIIAGIIFG